MRKLKQRLCSLLLCAALAVSLCVPAAAVDTVEESPQTVSGVSYLSCDEDGKNWKTETCNKYETVTNGDSTWGGGWYVVNDDNGGVNIEYVTVTGDVHLILVNQCILKVSRGIELNSDSSLTIYAQSTGENMGQLEVSPDADGDAGIAVNSGSAVTINGGTVIASGVNGAGIGGGFGGGGGEITISGGTVTATSAGNGAGNGGGKDYGDGTGGEGYGGKITITGGKVKATSNGDGAGGSYTPPTYKPEVEKPGEGGGTPSISPSKPEKGDTVTVTPKPDEGYEVDGITVTDKNGKPVEVTRNPDGTYTFTQPSSKVTIEVTYKAAEPAETPWSNPFADVDQGAWYYEAVRFVCERELMNGYGDGSFTPGGAMTRGMLTTVLYRAAGEPEIEDEIWGYPFADVNANAYYGTAVYWARINGIAVGSGGAFAPNAPITREQLAVMLWRYAGSPETGRDAEFADTAEISGYASEAVDWARASGVVNGKDGNRFDPKGQATRAEVAQMIKNFVEHQERQA